MSRPKSFLIGAKVWFLMSSFAASTSIRVNFVRMVTPFQSAASLMGKQASKLSACAGFKFTMSSLEHARFPDTKAATDYLRTPP